MTITKENTVAEVVSKKLGSDHVFSKYKIDFCCGGVMTLEAACAENGVDFEILKQEIESINNKISGEQNLNELDITTLMEKAAEEFHQYIYETLPQIMPLSSKVAEVHGSHNNEVVEINKLMQGVDIVLNEMLKNKEISLFPAIESVLALNNCSADISAIQIENIKKAIDTTGFTSTTHKEIEKDN